MKDICKPATEGPRATTQAPVSVARSMTCRTSKHAIRNSNCWNEKKKTTQRNFLFKNNNKKSWKSVNSDIYSKF